MDHPDRLEEFDEDDRPRRQLPEADFAALEAEALALAEVEEAGAGAGGGSGDESAASPALPGEKLSREEEMYVNQLLGVAGDRDDLPAPPPTPTFLEQHLAIVYEDTDEDQTDLESVLDDDESTDDDDEEEEDGGGGGAAAGVEDVAAVGGAPGQPQGVLVGAPRAVSGAGIGAPGAGRRELHALAVNPAADETEVRSRAANLLERMRSSLRRAEMHAKVIAKKDGARVRNPNLRVNTELAKKTASEREKRRKEREQQRQLREQQRQHQREVPIVPIREEEDAAEAEAKAEAAEAEAKAEAEAARAERDRAAAVAAARREAAREAEERDSRRRVDKQQQQHHGDDDDEKYGAAGPGPSAVQDRLATMRLQEDFERIDRLRLESERVLNECLLVDGNIFVKNTLLSLSESGGATARPMKLRALQNEVSNLSLLVDTMPDAGGSDYMEGLLTFRAVQFLDRVRAMLQRRDFRAVPSSTDTIEDSRDLVEMGASLVATICEAALMSEDLVAASREHVLVVAESILSLVRHVVLLVVVRDDVVRLVVDLLSGDIVPDEVFVDVVAIFFDTCATVMHFTMLHIPNLSEEVDQCKADESRWIRDVCRSGSELGTGKLRRGRVYKDALARARSHVTYNALQQALLMARDATDAEKDAAFVAMTQLRSFHMLAGNAFRLVQPRAPTSAAAAAAKSLRASGGGGGGGGGGKAGGAAQGAAPVSRIPVPRR